MRFNYDNPYNILAMIPHGACGQFINNCISISKYMMPVGNDKFLNDVLENGPDQTKKFDYMRSCFPSSSDTMWHGSFYHSSRWYSPVHWVRSSMDIDDTTNGYFQYGLDPSYARQYMDLYWRDHAKKISSQGYGIIMPGHELRDLEGWQTIFPDAKVYSVTNYSEISFNMTANKKSNPTPAIIKKYYQDNPWIYEPRGHVFDLMDILRSETSFYSQMKKAYEYFMLDDFYDCSDMLLEYRKDYLAANMKYRNIANELELKD